MLEVSTLTIKPLMNLSDLKPTIYHAQGEHNNKSTDEPSGFIVSVLTSSMVDCRFKIR
jgi:hypothetical protein